MRCTLMVFASLLAMSGLAVAATPPTKNPTTAPSATPAPQVHVIVVDTMQYGPMPTGVRAGDIIEWVNRGILEHTATARDGRFDIDLKPGATVRMKATAGTVEVYCKFHPTMVATLVVK
ncbi:plasmid stabilization protein [Rhodanobacter sp. Root627]|uniref:cupredoxin domain-containing protein n=1 Tax=Rhodanobacter sp. Root627 TaxID=1736572 RepID=UPI0006FE9E2F|nr:cupredoxin domain-containing protein [Rhodanobacter sp. Root627]KRA33611.1 plasmid stabilization protein [Rhodanobacter sp. Root627]